MFLEYYAKRASKHNAMHVAGVRVRIKYKEKRKRRNKNEKQEEIEGRKGSLHSS